MKQHDFDEPIDRIETDSYKWDYEGKGGKYIPLGVADTDFKIPKEAIDAMRKVLDRGVFGYGDLPQKRLSEAVCGWYARRLNTQLDPAWIVHAPGLMTGALWIILQAYTRPGDKIIVQSPVYNTFGKVILKQGRGIVENPLVLKDGRYEMDFEDLKIKARDPQVRMILLCSPHNPVGRVWTRDELGKVAEIAKETDTLIVSDEIHGDIVYTGHQQTTFVSLPDSLTEHVIVMNSPSKTFNVAALYSAYVIIKNKALREQFQVVSSDYHLDYNMLGLEALIACYNACDYYVEQQNAYFEQNIACVRDFLKVQIPDAVMIEPEGTYLLWIDFRKLGLSQDDLLKLFESAGVKVNSGANYGTGGEGFVRVNIATQRNVLKTALARLAKAYQAWKKA